MTDETTATSDTDLDAETQPEQQPEDQAALEGRTDKADKDASTPDVDVASLTDVEREHYHEGMSLQDVRKAVNDSVKALKAQHPGLTRAELEELLDQRFSALASDEPEEEPADVLDIRARIQDVVEEHRNNAALIAQISDRHGEQKSKAHRLEGRIEATGDPDEAAKLRHQLDMLQRELENDRREYTRLTSEQKRLAVDHRELLRQEKAAQTAAQRHRSEAQQEQARVTAEKREYLQQFNKAALTYDGIPEELRGKAYNWINGIAAVDLWTRTDKSQTDLAALARDYGKALVDLFQEWKKVEAKRAKSPVVAPRSGAGPTPAKPGQAPQARVVIDPLGFRKIPTRAEAQAELEAMQARARSSRAR